MSRIILNAFKASTGALRAVERLSLVEPAVYIETD
jgi:hypothetical protein